MSGTMDTARAYPSRLVPRQPNEAVTTWIDGIDDQFVYLSVITIGEIKRGIEKLPGSKRNRRLIDWLNEGLLIFGHAQ